MVKAVVESGAGAAAVSDMMIQKELQLSTLRAIQVISHQPQLLKQSAKPSKQRLAIAQSVLLLKHRQRFQTRLAIAFEQMLVPKPVAHV